MFLILTNLTLWGYGLQSPLKARCNRAITAVIVCGGGDGDAGSLTRTIYMRCVSYRIAMFRILHKVPYFDLNFACDVVVCSYVVDGER